MAAPRRGTLWFLLACLTVLALTEYAVITFLVLPLPSQRIDWLVATLAVAPMITLGFLGTAMLTARMVAAALASLRYIGRWITKNHRRPQGASAIPLPSTPSAAYPSSSAGWSSPGSSYTSPPGRERVPDYEPR